MLKVKNIVTYYQENGMLSAELKTSAKQLKINITDMEPLIKKERYYSLNNREYKVFIAEDNGIKYLNVQPLLDKDELFFLKHLFNKFKKRS